MANNSYDDIRQLLLAAVERQSILTGTVHSIDKDSRTCSIDIDGTILPEVMLQPITDGSTGVVAYPAIDAQALLLYNAEWDGWSLLQASAIESIEVNIEQTTITADKEACNITVGNSSIEVTQDSIFINGGKNKGLVNVEVLKSFLQLVIADLGVLSSALNVLGVTFTPTAKSIPDTIEDTAVAH